MLSSLLHTNDDIGLFIARISLGIVILPHGLKKLLGLFVGPGFSGTVDFFVGSGLPSAVAILLIITFVPVANGSATPAGSSYSRTNTTLKIIPTITITITNNKGNDDIL